MYYESTRDKSVKKSASDVITEGISKDGGLFVPASFPKMRYQEIADLKDLDYKERAGRIIKPYLSDFNDQEINECLDSAYNSKNFDTDDIAHLKKINEQEYVLELWHGPTCAFKDMALQLLPHLMIKSQKKSGDSSKIMILVATSGDTGKAALEGFKDVDGTEIVVFYPDMGVSEIQKLQMVTQQGKNVKVVAVKGNFDDAQSGVKKLFTDESVVKDLNEKGYKFSSANSINWGRLLPQIVYYFSAYSDLLKSGGIKEKEEINVVVPTGNFGNILAAYYAKRMGLPIHKLICASNSNNVLTDFFNNGVYNKNRNFYKTISPSMDILISSNLERLLYELTDRDNEKVNAWMNALKSGGEYKLDESQKNRLASEFWAGYSDDVRAEETIKEYYSAYHYVFDPHTAVAQRVYDDYKAETGDKTKTVIASTASPFKFCKDVLSSIKGTVEQDMDSFRLFDELSSISGMKVPESLQSLKTRRVLFSDRCEKSGMGSYILNLIK